MDRSGKGLLHYIFRRLLLMVPTFVGVTMVVFVLCQFVPGGPVAQYMQRLAAAQAEGGPSASSQKEVRVSEDDLAALKAYYGFDQPMHMRYLRYLGNLVQLDLGTSFRFSVPTIQLIRDRLPVSIFYGLVTTVLTYAICIPLGIVKAITHRTPLDYLTSLLIYVGYAIPGYALGALLLAMFAVKRDWFPLGGFKSEGFDAMTPWGKARDVMHHAILPLTCYMIGSFAVMTALVKNSLMENMSADFVRTALASGLSWRRAIFVHALRNSLIPLATSFGNNIGLLLAGSLLIERVFSIPGMGLLFYESVLARDFPVVLGITVISTALLLVGNLLSDLCVAAVDPRVRFQ